jgi:TRAP-type C4-dicarboxylate transport system permease small subunit
MMLLLALIFLYYGYQFAQFGAIQISEIASLPMLTIFIAWPLAGLTWLLFIGERIVSDLRAWRGVEPLKPRPGEVVV